MALETNIYMYIEFDNCFFSDTSPRESLILIIMHHLEIAPQLYKVNFIIITSGTTDPKTDKVILLN